MKLYSGLGASSFDITFRKEVAKGASLNDPGDPNLIVFEGPIPFWGVLKSTEVAVYRDGARADDVGTRTIGVSDVDGLVWLKFQMFDGTVGTVTDHSYVLEAQLHFYGGAVDLS